MRRAKTFVLIDHPNASPLLKPFARLRHRVTKYSTCSWFLNYDCIFPTALKSGPFTFGVSQEGTPQHYLPTIVAGRKTGRWAILLRAVHTRSQFSPHWI